MELSIPIWRRAPRTSLFIILAVILLAAIYVVSPAQLPVVLYKVSLIALAGVLGYWLDRVLFPYARPDSYLTYDWRAGSDEPIGEADHPVCADHMRAFCAAQLRRAIIVGSVIFGVAAGL